jgi:hypothetical protein
MGKNNSRLSRVEKSLNMGDDLMLPIPIIMWNRKELDQYFIDSTEKKDYEIWRVSIIREKYRHKGLPIPSVYYLVAENIPKYIETFRTQKSISNMMASYTLIELTNYADSFSNNENKDDEIIDS